MSLFNTLMASAIPLVPRALIRKVSRRYIAGETAAEALVRVRALDAQGFSATLDVLGESVSSLSQADRTTDEYLRVLDAIGHHGLHANISIKPTALGLLLDEAHCENNFRRLLAAAERHGIFVRIDMEDASVTQKEIDLLARLKRDHDRVGIVLQAYLKRTYDDIEPLLGERENLRLCKGIYVEGREHLVDQAWRDRRAINAHFLNHAARCFDSATFVGLATHDEELIGQLIDLARRKGIDKGRFEFQMLLGVCENLQGRLLGMGYAVRIYVPYGRDWYGYSMRRIKENPQIAGYLMKAALGR
ncbi:proline dehydrogenase family protein [Polaromonas sp. A23]|uniref:proline dehydrogenase family protein n=1 Tax=Polaromonas sp. A23 TaxID=1944133 RepID=UPI000984C4E5|nr:proline dehydrogenase family protein [Polaromonas sp. A23]OOG36507.1 L-proline dehydrogenase [Polaromonas sp. A23]